MLINVLIFGGDWLIGLGGISLPRCLEGGVCLVPCRKPENGLDLVNKTDTLYTTLSGRTTTAENRPQMGRKNGTRGAKNGKLVEKMRKESKNTPSALY
jgi:hypothetical protein